MTLTSAPVTTTLDLREKIQKLTEIGIALSSEHNLRNLLESIVKEARGFTQADGASLYIKEKGKLKFVISQTASMKERNSFLISSISQTFLIATAACEASERMILSYSKLNVVTSPRSSRELISCRTPIISSSWSRMGRASMDFDRYPVRMSKSLLKR